MRRWIGTIILLGYALGSSVWAAPSAVHFVAGKPSHGWGEHEYVEACNALAGALNESGLPIRAVVHKDGWPADEVLADAKAVVIYCDGEDEHVAKGKLAALRTLRKRGVALACLHYTLEPTSPEMAQVLIEAIGGCFEPNWSVNPLWTPAEMTLAKHPVCRGVTPFSLKDEWYYHMRFREGMAGVTPLISVHPPLDTLSPDDGPRTGNPALRRELKEGVSQHLAWASVDANGVRGFGFSGGHFLINWANPNFRMLVLNGIVWAAGLEVPPKGVISKPPLILKNKTLARAVAMDDVADIQRHLLKGADINAQSGSGFSALHHAAVRGKVKAAQVLLRNGANVDLQTTTGKTPLHYAADRNFLELAKLLLDHGAKIGLKDQEGWTALHFAATKDHLEMTKMLLDKGADVNAASNGGGCPLHEAAASASKEMIQLLLARGADPAIKAKTGKTPLDYAVELDNKAAIEVLKARK